MSINLPQFINTDFKPVAFIRTGKLPCESTFIFPFTYVYPFRGKYSINILLLPFIRNSCLWQRKRNNLTNKYNKKLLSLPSKINPNPDLPAAFIPFFRRIFFMAYAMKIHLKKNAAAKGLELKERFQNQWNIIQSGGLFFKWKSSPPISPPLGWRILPQFAVWIKRKTANIDWL